MIDKIQLLVILVVAFLVSCTYSSATESDRDKEPPRRSAQHWERMGESGWESFRRVSFKYDDEGMLRQELSKKMVEDSMISESRVLREYDENGNEIRVIRERWIEQEWVFAMQSAYEFEADRIVMRIDSMVNKNGAQKIVVTYNYDEANVLLSEVSQNTVDGEKFIMSKIVYQYNDSGLVSLKEFPIWSDDRWTKSRKMILGYDDAGDHVYTTRFNWKDGEWVENLHYDLEVGEDGNRLKEFWKRSKDDVRKDFMRITYSYLDHSE